MRKTLLASATLLALGLAAPGFAQESANWPYAHQPGTGESGPASTEASNIDSADSHSAISPHLPAPPMGEHGTPEQYLRVAEHALDQHQSGEAQQALEMAETRLLDRSLPPADASTPDQSPEIQHVSTALRDLGNRNWQGTRQAIDMALAAAPTQQ
jgi:hypothetical protein